jgi:hypothetical protein
MASTASWQDWSDRRDAPRTRVKMPARVQGEFFSCDGTLLNISRSGAMLATVHPPRAGRDVMLVCRNVKTIARIVWVSGRHLGLSFDADIGEEKVSRLVAVAAA